MITNCDYESGSEIYTDGNKALKFCKAIPNSVYDKEIVDIHFVWREPLRFGRKQILPIKSAITTQNLNHVNVILWSNTDLSNNEYLLPYLSKVELKMYDPVKEAKGTPLEGWRGLVRDDDKFWVGGDLFRLLILYNYGGVYCDSDIVLLRDLAPLLDQEFMYQWGSETDKINGAIMRMYKGSKLATDCVNIVKRIPCYFNSTNWGSGLYGEVRKFNKDWTVFPCAFFNTEWQLGINMDASAHPFRSGPDSHLDFEGAFAWHWHNKWDCQVEHGCKFERLERKVNEDYERMFGGLRHV